MRCILVIIRYPKGLGWAGLLSMVLFRIPLALHHRIRFWKLLGCGKNGSFDRTPDLRQWGILVSIPATETDIVNPDDKQHNRSAFSKQLPAFIDGYFRIFHAKICYFLLEPLEGRGTWDGRNCFGELPRHSELEGPVAVLTRATLHLNRMKAFWNHVEAVSQVMRRSRGFVTSVGIGELPWVRQATFSIWESKKDMQQFAYGMAEHRNVIRKTREENWYREEMFVRFRILQIEGFLNGKDLKQQLAPLQAGS